MFADSLLEATQISEHFKQRIREIQRLSKEWGDYDIKTAPAEDWIKIIKYYESHISNYNGKNVKKEIKLKIKISIRQYTLDGCYVGEYENISKAARAAKISADSIGDVAAGRKQSAGGFLWRKCDSQSPKRNIEPPKNIDVTGKTIYQINIDGVIIGEFPTIAAAARSARIDRKGIRDVLNGRQKTAGGYYWKAI